MGLLRAGVTEIELFPNRNFFLLQAISDLFQTFANNAVRMDQVPIMSLSLSRIVSKVLYIQSLLPWEKGLILLGHKTSMDAIIFNRR
ncbi:hypothetical protein CW304_00495 [Bacillus sp. UFRGS-B20]|nr:hypothetical protein CW304_00495 [Bacillus sp. UFRGS-B20]